MTPKNCRKCGKPFDPKQDQTRLVCKTCFEKAAKDALREFSV